MLLGYEHDLQDMFQLGEEGAPVEDLRHKRERGHLTPVKYLVVMCIQRWAGLFCNKLAEFLTSYFPPENGMGDCRGLLMLGVECDAMTDNSSIRLGLVSPEDLVASAEQAVIFLNTPHNKVIQGLMHEDGLVCSRSRLLEAQEVFDASPDDAGAAAMLLIAVRGMAIEHIALTCFIGTGGFLRSVEAGECIKAMKELKDTFMGQLSPRRTQSLPVSNINFL